MRTSTTLALVLALAAATAAALAQDAPYCADLKELNNLAMSQRRFAPIIGAPRAGNFRETTLR